MRKSMNVSGMLLTALTVTMMMVSCDTAEHDLSNDVWQYPVISKDQDGSGHQATGVVADESSMKPEAFYHYKVTSERPFGFAIAKEQSGRTEWIREYALNTKGSMDNATVTETPSGDLVIVGTLQTKGEEGGKPTVISLSQKGNGNWSKQVMSGPSEEVLSSTIDEEGRIYVSVKAPDNEQAKKLYLLSLQSEGGLEHSTIYAETKAEIIVCDMNPFEKPGSITLNQRLDKETLSLTLQAGKVTEITSLTNAVQFSKEGKPIVVREVALKVERIK